jgi:hypothetical protein
MYAKTTKSLIITLLLFFSFSCEENSGNENLSADEQLISSIESSSDLATVDESDLPALSQATLNEDYTESTIEDVQVANGLGYIVFLRRHKGIEFGLRVRAFFKLNGRELRRRIHRAHDRFDCFEFVYPISVTMPDSSIISATSEEELKMAVKDWYTSNPDTKESRPELVYPIDVILADSGITTINSREELLDVCPHDHRGEKGFRRPLLFKFVYPITFVMSDSSEVSGNSKEELWTAIKAWHVANPDLKVRGKMKFPVDIKFMDDSIVTVNSREDIKDEVKTWIQNHPRSNK